ncbi:hypothetical protein [uncultured Rhodospira sp.]|uniref:hypothetical protein n=1 Tax=uncultured Rhodospira sp. TaxID=1936189 RepID=UPI002625392D|nr:hypothetical protein [uncultured Rhodospira sp.]
MVRRPDPATVAVSIVDHGLRLLKMDATASARIGLTGLHICPNHAFAAQIWLAESAGVYAIETLPTLAPDPLTPDDAGRATMLVRYFPHPDEPSFAALSADERVVRLDPGFTTTGAPDGALTRDLFDTPLFGVGLLRLARATDGTAQSVAAVSGTPEGWHTVRPLLDALITMLAFTHRVQPAAVTTIGRPGEIGLHVVLPAAPTPTDPVPTRPGAALAAFVAAAGATETRPDGAPARWWEAAAWEAHPDSKPCACCSGDHDVTAPHGHHGHHHHHGHHSHTGTRAAESAGSPP